MSSSSPRYLIQGGTLITMNEQRQVFVGDLRIQDGKITELAPSLKPQPGEIVVSVHGNFVIPGLIQVHTHLCQTLFRGMADDLALLEWLTQKIWPYEAAHNQASMRASARIGLLEMQRLGTTSILDMASTRTTEAVFEAAIESKMRYWGGNCWADYKSTSGPLYMDIKDTKAETERLLTEFHQKTSLLRFALSPRFAVSCSEKILRWGVEMQSTHGLLIHTHASENKAEIAMIKARTGRSNVDYLGELGLLNSRSVIVHGVYLTGGEIRKMVGTQTHLVHCPSSNLKLASGVAPIERYMKAAMNVALGSDGAPCNNTMDPFLEMRLAALLQKPRFGPEALPAQQAFEMATLKGAKALGRETDLGSLEVGKFADIVVVDRRHPSQATVENPYSALVYSCSGRDVEHVWINGHQVVKKFSSTVFDQDEVCANASSELKKLVARA